MKKNRFFGPSTLIAAAFIGPGTVTVCIVTGQVSGFTLLWALLLALGVTFFLQEMTGRLGLISKKGLGEAISGHIRPLWWKLVLVVGCIVAIGIGNAAYEGGNLTGASLGLEGVFGSFQVQLGNFTLRL